MTQEDIELLLKDLCARMPYHIKVAINYEIYLNFIPDEKFKECFLFLLEYDKKTIEEKSLEPHIIYAYPCRNRFMTFTGCHDEYGIPIEAIKPYLRTMSSMTFEEKREFLSIGDNDSEGFLLKTNKQDWLNEHHFDYRGLIPMGLALEAPIGMYK